jgi:Protein of unknown function (DUF1553)
LGGSPPLPSVADIEAAINKGMGKPADKRSRDELAELEKNSAEHARRLKELKELIEKRDTINKSIPRVMVMQDVAKPRKTQMLEKGLYTKPGDEVSAAVPARLGTLPTGTPANRLGLAQWLVARENPLTARVTVNRFWQQFFGVGLVKTAEDFGVQGERPVHPQLLDWLACEFVETGWDVKKLCRLIVTSATYRQSSRLSAELIERDPENRLLARGPRFRMPSWMIRDQALAASGLMARTIGGRPVKPYQPSGIWEEATFGQRTYAQDHGEALYRRSLYIFWRRIVGPTMFFDNAARQVCTVKMSRTNTPLQALLTLNDITYVEAARAMAQRVILTGGANPRERLDLAMRLVLARPPSPAQSEVLLKSLDRVKNEFTQNPESAKKLLAIGESKRDELIDPIEHAAWTQICSVILNLDEALTKE